MQGYGRRRRLRRGLRGRRGFAGSLGGWLAALILATLLACAERDAIDRDLPDGALLAGDAIALQGILHRLEGLAGTPIAREARAWHERLEGCSEFVARAERFDADALLDSLQCPPSDPLPAAVSRLRGEGHLVVVVPLGGRGRLAGNARVEPAGSVRVRARLALESETGWLGFVLPAAEPPGPPALSARDTLFHARLRPVGGLALASLVSRESQADRLFRLRSELFAGAVLDGTWEAAAYMPEEGHLMPALAVGVGIKLRGAAVAAMEKFVSDLQSTWPVHRVPFSVGGREGACLPDLRILPEFAPCYVATDDHLIAGWNAESVRAALAPSEGPGPEALGGWVFHLGRLARADERLRRAVAPRSLPLDFDYAWQRLVVRTRPERGSYRIEVDLQSKEST